MTDEKMAEEYVKSVIDVNAFDWKIVREICLAFLAGLKADRLKWHKANEWHKYSERPKEKVNALCFDSGHNKFILGFYDLEADEWLRYGGYETIHIDLWKKIEVPKEDTQNDNC